MSISGGDAAEQVVRFSLEGMEMAVKLAGSGAKELATFLYAILRDSGGQKAENPMTLKGRERLTTMLKSGKELKVFALKDADLKAFCSQAKRYGVGYCVVRKPKKDLNGLCDVMVPAEQAPMVARILERFAYAPTDRATLHRESEHEKDRGVMTKDPAEFLQELSEEGAKRGAPPQVDPTPARGEPQSSHGSAPSSSGSKASSSAKANEKPSVKERLFGIAAALEQRSKRDDPAREKSKARKVSVQQQPKARRKARKRGASRGAI